ncbi:MAG: hypothetical protein R3B13_37500 [Polyangiaceae bacterium]
MRTTGYVLTAAGAVASVFGAVSYLDFTSKRSQAEDICPGDNCANRQKKNEYDRLKPDVDAAGTRAAWGIGLGLTAIAGGVALIVLAPESHETQASVRVGPTVSVHGYGLRVGGTW